MQPTTDGLAYNTKKQEGSEGLQEPEFVPGQVLVKFRTLTIARAADAMIASPGIGYEAHSPGLAAVLSAHGVVDVTPVFPTHRIPQALHNTDDEGKILAVVEQGTALENIVRLSLPPSIEQREETLSLVADLQKLPEIAYAEPNYILHALWIPNDPYYSSTGAWGQNFPDLWGLKAIDIEQAWDVSKGQGVIVAVIDTGVDSMHPDLALNMWTNPGESGEKAGNGIDDDGNGFIDDDRGWNFVRNSNSPLDDFGHGSHVAGTIAAVGNNGTGIIGVAPEAKIMALKVLNNAGDGTLEDAGRAITYAANNGARVINASFGAPVQSKVLADAVRYAHDVKGVVVITAAGNSNTDASLFTPANLPEAITVSAITHESRRAFFSNFGEKIDVAAPGGGDSGPSTMYQPFRSILSLKASMAVTGMTGNGTLVIGSLFLRQAGTSMAAPHVAGLTALIRSRFPGYTAEQVRQALRMSSDDILATGIDPESGYGRINARRALSLGPPLNVFLRPIMQTPGQSSLPIYGTAEGHGFANWTVAFRREKSTDAWQTIASGTAPVHNGLLGQWHVSSLAQQFYSVRLSATIPGFRPFTYVTSVKLVFGELQFPVPTPTELEQQSILEPIELNLVNGKAPVTIRGTVQLPGLQHYTLRLLTQRPPMDVPGASFSLAAGGTQMVLNGTLGTLSLTGVPSGFYTVQLSAQTYTAGSQILASAFLTIDTTLRDGWPQRIPLIDGPFPGTILAIPHSPTMADINGDGKQEIIVVDASAIRVFSGNGSPLPGWPRFTDDPAKLFNGSYAIGNLTGNARPEIVAERLGDIGIWGPDGQRIGGWSKHPSFCMASIGLSLAIEDINGDGQNEIILLCRNSGVSLRDRNGNLLWSWLSPDFAHFHPSPPAIGDIDGDGRKEIIFLSSTNIWDRKDIVVLRSDGTMAQGWPKVLSTDAGTFGGPPALVDLDGNGLLDIVVPGDDDKIYAYRGDGTSLPGWPHQTATGYCEFCKNGLAVGNIDGDGKPEILLGNGSGLGGNPTNYLGAWRADGTPVAGWPVSFTLHPSMSSFQNRGFHAPIIADLDGDSRFDVAAAHDSNLMIFDHPSYPPPTPLSPLAAYRSNGSPLPGFPKMTYSVGNWPTNAPAVGDVDGDGKLELAWLDLAGNLYVWNTPGPASPASPWPMVFHSPLRDSRFVASFAPPPPSSSSSSSRPPSSSNSSSRPPSSSSQSSARTSSSLPPPPQPSSPMSSICQVSSFPATIPPGQSFPATLTLRNTTNVSWLPGSHVLAVLPQWGTPNIDREVRPGESFTWKNFPIVAPSSPGPYDITYQMWTNGGSFGELCPKRFLVQ